MFACLLSLPLTISQNGAASDTRLQDAALINCQAKQVNRQAWHYRIDKILVHDNASSLPNPAQLEGLGPAAGDVHIQPA